MVSRRCTWFTGAAVLFAGLTNAHSHVHLCFDGREPAATVHHVDTLQHAHEIPAARDDHHASHAADHDHDFEHDDGEDHDDLDLDVPNDALAKTYKHDLPAALTAATELLQFAPQLGPAPARGRDIAPAPDPHYLRPPLRGPPF